MYDLTLSTTYDRNDPKKEKLFQIGKEVLYYDTAKEKHYSINWRKNRKVCT